MESRMMTIEEVAAYLNLSRETLYKYVQKSLIPALKIGRHWRFDKNTLDAWIREGHKPGRGGPILPSKEVLSLLIVEDDPLIRKLITAWVTEAGCEVLGAENGAQAIELLRSHDFDLMFLDLHLPDMTGADVLRQMPAEKQVPAVVITGYPESPVMDETVKHEVLYALTKPFRQEEVVRVLDFVRSGPRRLFVQGELQNAKSDV